MQALYLYHRPTAYKTGMARLCDSALMIRGGVEDTRLEAKAKDTKKIRGQGQPFRGQNLLRPRTGMLEAKASKDQGHRHKRSPQKKRFSNFFFRRSPIYWRTQNF